MQKSGITSSRGYDNNIIRKVHKPEEHIDCKFFLRNISDDRRGETEDGKSLKSK